LTGPGNESLFPLKRKNIPHDYFPSLFFPEEQFFKTWNRPRAVFP
jgi:hypothetical protein